MKYNLNLTRDEFLGVNVLNIEEVPECIECIITPEVLMQKGSLLFEGPAKVGKTDFVFSWMAHMAAGVTFIEMTPVRPLKIFYLHASSVDQGFKKKIRKMGIDQKLIPLVHQNLIASPSFKMKLGEEELDLVAEQILTNFDRYVDIIVIDSIEDFYDGSASDLKEENDAALISFSETRIEALRQMVNPNAALIVIHESNRKPEGGNHVKRKR